MNINPKMFHISDGKRNSEKDEHLNIGEGDYDFEFLMSCIKEAKSRYMTLETPRTKLNSFDEDLKNLERLAGVAQPSSTGRRGTERYIYIGEEKWQEKGYASDALQLLLKYGFCELRLHRIYAVIFEYNESSIKFFEKNGFKFEGKHREARFWDSKFHDELVYGVLDYEYFEGF